MSESLYSLTDDFLQLMQLCDSEDEEDKQVFLDTLEGILGAIEVKADGYAAVMERIDSAVDRIDKEIKRLQALKKRNVEILQKMKDRLKETMLAIGKKEIKTDLHTFKTRKAGGKLGIEIIGPVPDKYKKVIYEDDMDKIREALEAGENLDFARFKERGTILKID